MTSRNKIYISSGFGDNQPVAARTRKSGWGGSRPGAGRPRVVKDPERVAVDLEKPQFDLLREIAEERGDSVASLIREAVDRFLARRRKS